MFIATLILGDGIQAISSKKVAEADTLTSLINQIIVHKEAYNQLKQPYSSLQIIWVDD